MVLTKFLDTFKIGDSYYLFNLNNASLIQLDRDIYEKIDAIKQNNNLSILTNDEKNILISQGFLVDDNFDKKQISKNKMTYLISKYNNNKDTVKIDFALTNLCNFNCPYCFEKNNLCHVNQSENRNYIYETGKDLTDYLKLLISKGIKKIEIVFYGGEPTIEKDFIIKFLSDLSSVCVDKNVEYEYTFITNGYLFDYNFASLLKSENCKFIQITLDGEKILHNSRRTNLAKINTFDTIIRNINHILSLNFNVVIRLNIDKTNYESVYNLLNNLENIIDKKYFGKNLGVDIARVFGSINSYDLLEYEDYRKKLIDLCIKKHLYTPRVAVPALTTFCIAESLTNDLVLDYRGNLYRCWNNVFDEEYKIGNIKTLLARGADPWEDSDITLRFVEELSLENVNKNKCFECVYSKYCQGLCPAVRKNIKEGNERNIYLNNECKQIIRNRLKQLIYHISMETIK
ncbi:MAG TPA: SPASM domain-containing protein [Candidatus Onthoplasma faecipullorum]|nr:SPASM domain-containing protein [Candidatus Onthoplasma faecipullorum]